MKKNISDLAIWITEAIQTVYGIKFNWRDIKKFMDDFEQDNKIEFTAKRYRLKVVDY